MTKLLSSVSVRAGALPVVEAVPGTFPFYAQVDAEYMLVRSDFHKGSGLFWRVTRAQLGTQRTGHAADTAVYPVTVQVQTGAPAAPPPALGDQGGAGNYAPPIPQSDVTGLEAALAAAGIVKPVTIALSSAQVATLSSVPIEVLPAPGAGKVILPVQGVFQYVPGTNPFAKGATIHIGELPPQGFLASFVPDLALVEELVGFGIDDPYLEEDTALVVSADVDPGWTGAITASSSSDGGSGYTAGDAGSITPSIAGGALGTYVIDTVDGGGGVLTFHITAGGTRYSVAFGYATIATSGGGSGFGVNVDTVSHLSDGTARLTVLYCVMDLA